MTLMAISARAVTAFEAQASRGFQQRILAFLSRRRLGGRQPDPATAEEWRGYVHSAEQAGLDTERLIAAYAYASAILHNDLIEVDPDFVQRIASEPNAELRFTLLEERTLSYAIALDGVGDHA